MGFQPSNYQQAIYSFIENDTRSAVIEAVAGSGKTTTVLECLKLIPKDKTVILLAFNKSIADELKTKAPAHVDVKTFNGLGHSILGSRLGRVSLDTYKLRNILKTRMDSFDYSDYGDIVFSLIGYARRFGLLPNGVKGISIMDDTMQNWEYLIDRFNIPVESEFKQSVIDYARECIIESIKLCGDKKIVDFDDQLYVPAIKNMKGNSYDYIFVDEAQDVSPVRTALIKLIKADTGRVIAVGDSCQPLGTQVNISTFPYRMNNQYKTINIEDIKIGDMVVSYNTKDCSFIASGKRVNGITRRKFTGNLIVIKTDTGLVSKYTPNHKCLVNFNNLRDKFCVYLMQKNNQFRIGKAKMSYSGASGISARMHHEKADKVWILSIYDTEREAFFWEQAISGKYGIPQLMFNHKKMISNNAEVLLTKTWEFIGDNTNNAIKLLNDFNRHIDYPLFISGNSTQQTIKRPIVTYAANLIDGVTVLPLNNAKVHSNKIDWIPIKVSYEYYDNDVISLDVDSTHLYVADGIVTHNCQAIYGFTGSDSEAMNTLRSTFDAVSLPLSISYRCAKNIIIKAQSVMPTIEYNETAPDGEVNYLNELDCNTLKPADMIICRKNAPIISLAFKLISKGIPAKVMGRDIGAGLVKLIEKLKPKGIDGKHGLIIKLTDWQNKETAKFQKDDNQAMIDSINDKVACIMAVVDRSNVSTVPDLIREIESLFSDDGNNKRVVILSSIHKSKGLEAETVYFLDSELIPLKFATKDWQLEQEYNLLYVGITRAKKVLNFISSANIK